MPDRPSRSPAGTGIEMRNYAGKFIVLDGPDGCGKTTQCQLLKKFLQGRGLCVRSFRDPGTTDIGEKIRRILLDNDHESMTTTTEVLLYMAARVQLWHEKIAPALDAGDVVVLDRWLSSTCAYQGYAGGFGMDKVVEIAQDSLERPWPDLTIILDIDTETAMSRISRKLDRMEQKPRKYHKKVRQGYLTLARKRQLPVIDATGDIQEIFAAVRQLVQAV